MAKILRLTPQERDAHGGATHKVIVTYADLTGTAATSLVQPVLPLSGTFAAGTSAALVAMKLITPFDGGATSDLTVKVGDGGDDDRFLAATIVHEDASEVDYAEGIHISNGYDAADALDVTWTATGANLTVLTTGEAHFLFAIRDAAETPGGSANPNT